jgi:putative effector of murein hydrolase LrgA (UPF0299 family)
MSRAALLPPVLLGLVILLLAQMVGLALSELLGLPVPGVVLGLLLIVLLGVLRPTRAVVTAAEPAATPLLQHLQLLFVPPGAGIVLELRTLAENALALALAVGGSFVLALVVSGLLLQALLRRQDRRRGGPGEAADGPAGSPSTDGPAGSRAADGPAGTPPREGRGAPGEAPA